MYSSLQNWSWWETQGPLPFQTQKVLISLLQPLRFSASPCTSLSLSKVVRVEYELWVMRGRYGRLCSGGDGGYTQVSTPQFWPAMARLGHLSIQEGPRRCPHYAGPCSTTRRAHGEEGWASSPLPPSPCLSVTTPIGKTSNMNSNKHNNNPAAARALNGCWRWWWIIEATSISQRDVRTRRAINWIITSKVGYPRANHPSCCPTPTRLTKKIFIIQPTEAINHLFIFHDACLMKYVKRMKFL